MGFIYSYNVAFITKRLAKYIHLVYHSKPIVIFLQYLSEHCDAVLSSGIKWLYSDILHPFISFTMPP